MKISQDAVKKAARGVAYLASVSIAGFLIWFLIRYGADLWKIFTGGNAADNLSQFVRQFGIWGPVILILFQTLQIAVAFLPGEPVELAAGMLYGGFFGCILCLTGVLLGSMAVYYAVAKLGRGVIAAFHDESKLSRLKMFHNTKNAEFLTAILFLVPGIPKDFITFAAPLTPMKPWRFFMISTLARAPGMFITTYAGVSLLNGDWLLTLILYGVLGIGAIIGLIGYRRLCKAEDEEIQSAETKKTV